MKKELRNNRLLWSCLFRGWAILIVILTAMPYNQDRMFRDKDFWLRPDYVEHLSFYILLAVLFVPYYYGKEKKNRKMSLSLWIAAGILFAAITEFYQLYIPNRSFNLWDMFLNINGILIGIWLGPYLFRKWRVT